MELLKLAAAFEKIAIRKNKVLVNRVRLIRGMLNALNSIKDPDFKSKIKDCLTKIKNDILKDYLSLDTLKGSLNVTYFTKVPKDKYSEKDRTKTTLGKYLRRNFDLKLDTYNLDKSLTEYVNEVLKNIVVKDDLDEKIEMLDSDSVTDFYKGSDEIAHSCMTGDSARNTQLYAMNPDKVKLVVLGGKARALLWTTDDGKKVLDRAYPSGSKEIQLLRQWAKMQGYILRDNPDALVSDGTVDLSDNSTRHITLKHNNVFPYMDTFCYGEFDEEDPNIVVVSNSEEAGNLKFHETDGGYTGGSGECSECGREISDTHTAHIVDDETFCERCYNNRFVRCHACNYVLDTQNDDYQSDENDIYCTDCFYKYFFNCQDCGEATPIEDAVLVCSDSRCSDKEHYCEYCAKKETDKCEECKRNFKLGDLYEIYNYQAQHLYNMCQPDSDEFAHKCNECSNYFNYELKSNYCAGCKPNYYSLQYKLPLDEESKELNKELQHIEAQFKQLLKLIKN